MKKSRADILKAIHTASSWIQSAFEDARDSDMADVAGHLRASQMSLNAALGALNKTKAIAS